MLLDVSAKLSMRTRTWPSTNGWSVAVCRRVVGRLSLRIRRLVVLMGSISTVR